MRRTPSKNRLSCFCTRKPLLAIWGNDETGKPYVHVRIYKQGRIFGDVLVYGGEVRICCRECCRWHRINFVSTGARLVETTVPEEVDTRHQMAETDSNEG